MKKLCFCIMAALAFFTHELNAQCVEPPNFIIANSDWANIGLPAQAGSSFTACMDGELTQLSIRFNMSNIGGPGTLIIRDVAMSGALGTVGATHEYSQAIAVNAGAGIQHFLLDTPYWVSHGASYAWFVEGPESDFQIDSSEANSYSNGGSMDNEVNPKPHEESDLAFQVLILPKPIPTLSQWGFIILGLCLCVIGITMVRQRMVVAAVNNRKM